MQKEVTGKPITGDKLADLKKRITDLESSRFDLRIGESTLKMLTERAMVGVYVIQDNTMMYVNESVGRMLDYAPEEIIGKMTPYQLIHPEDHGTLTASMKARLGGTPQDRIRTYRGVKKDGSIIYIDLISVPSDLGGKPAIMGMVVDVTERIKAEDAIKESESKYRTLFQNANDAIFLMRDAVFLDCNDKTLEMFRCEKSELIGKSPIDFSPPIQPDGEGSSEKAMRKIRAAHEAGPQRFEWLHTAADGSAFFAEVSLNAVTIKSERILLAIVRDISERKKAEHALRESEEKFRALAENSEDVIERCNREGKYLYVNPAVEKQTGIPAGIFLGKTLREVGFPESICGILDGALDQVLSTGQPGRIEFQLPNGKYVDRLLMPEYDEAGNVVAVITAGRDISEKKDFETKEKLFLRTQRLASFGGLTSAIAHEIRQPLHLIKVISDSYLFLRSEGDQAALESIDLVKSMEEISRGVVRIDDIITNLQALMKNTQKIKKTPEDVNRLLNDVLQYFKQKLIMHGIRLTLDLDERMQKIWISSVQFQEIVTNLLNNAVDALDSVEKEDKRISIVTRSLDDYVVLEVADNGPGIDDAIKGKIFDPLFSTKQGDESMGLGLYIVQNIVQSMTSKIEVADNRPSGAVFKVTLKKSVL